MNVDIKDWSWTHAAEFAVAVGKLACFALDELWQDDQFDGCCPRCCAACSGLHALLHLGILDQVVASAQPVAEGSPWWLQTGMVDRDLLAGAWRMTICHADLTERHSTDT